MRPTGLLAFAAAAAALGACASAVPPPDAAAARMSAQVFDDAAIAAPAQPAPAPFDAMRAALPTFDLQQNVPGGEVSVVRDILFPPESSILSRPQLDRLVPLQAYLRANPATAVRIEGHGDAASEQDSDLPWSRAQAVARALLTDMRISTDRITADAGRRGEWGRAEIILVAPLIPQGVRGE